MKKKLLLWVLKQLNPKYTKKQIELINKFKSTFRIFFEGGYEYDQVYDVYIPLTQFGITNLDFSFTKDQKLNVKITLVRPGILIGKGGKTIDSLTNYLKDVCNLNELTIEESKLWNRLK